jgi:trans-aconitate 2-methyltransferase
MTTQNHYTFGDGERAARRLALLSHTFEEPSRALLERFRPASLPLALDLGSGPGYTTRLVHAACHAERTIGVEASEKYLEQARADAVTGIEFMQDDVTAPQGAVPAAGLVFCRFVLTHVADPAAAIRAFRRYVAPAGRLLLQETAHLESPHPAFARYYELVGQMQAHYGQLLYIGQELERLATGAPFQVVHSGVRRFERPAATMAELHVQNLQTWRNDAFAQRAFDAGELDELERRLLAISRGEERAEPVSLGLGELVLS